MKIGMEELIRQISELYNEIQKMQKDLNINPVGSLASRVDENNVIDFRSAINAKPHWSIEDYQWKNYVNNVEQYYHLKRAYNMLSIYNMPKSELDNKKKEYMDYISYYYNEINNLLSNPKLSPMIEKYGLHPSNRISAEEDLRRHSTIGTYSYSTMTYNAVLNNMLNNYDFKLKELPECVNDRRYHFPNKIEIDFEQLKEMEIILSDIIGKISTMSDEEFKWYLINDMQPTQNELETLKSKGIELPTTGFSR